MHENTPPLLKRISFRLRYVWRLAIPFWIFRDAGRGSMEQRVANYRYNRAKRKVLPFYVWKWVGIAFCMLQMMRLLSDRMTSTTEQSAGHLCATLFCMSAGIGFAFACIVITVLSSSYLYLTYVKR